MFRPSTQDAPGAAGRRLPLATALREAFRGGYQLRDGRNDLAAGVITGIVALPLSMALAIACGVPPQHGLYTAIVAGMLIALLGGAHTSVSGPTAAFVVILVPITARYGLAGLAIASLMAGVLLVIMGFAGLGKLIQYVPHPVTTGFTSGIAVVIATLQIKDLLGLKVAGRPEHFHEHVLALINALPGVRWSDLAVGLATLAVLLLWPRLTRKVPAPLVALLLAAVLAWGAQRVAPGFQVATISSRFQYTAGGAVHPGIPRKAPHFVLPWNLPGPGGQELEPSFNLFRALAGSALAIAMLGAIESLLCAVVADGMTGTKHDPDAELVAQGVGNIVAPFFGGFAATAAIARTATAIRAGARSPLAAALHALFVLASMLALAPLLGYLPMASLAALLMLVAWNMSEVKHFSHTLRVAPLADRLVLLTCFVLTVAFDMVVSVTAGVMLSALLFMKGMSDLASVRLSEGEHPQLVAKLPPGVLLYEVAGPLFFGAAEKFAGTLAYGAGKAQAVILYLGGVPTIDMTGLVALESTIRKLQNAGALVVLAGVQPQPARVLAKAGIRRDPGKLSLCQSLEEAEMLVRLVLPERSAQPAAEITRSRVA
jgi:SulP family sulfate permease